VKGEPDPRFWPRHGCKHYDWKGDYGSYCEMHKTFFSRANPEDFTDPNCWTCKEYAERVIEPTVEDRLAAAEAEVSRLRADAKTCEECKQDFDACIGELEAEVDKLNRACIEHASTILVLEEAVEQQKNEVSRLRQENTEYDQQVEGFMDAIWSADMACTEARKHVESLYRIASEGLTGGWVTEAMESARKWLEEAGQ
jgi:chromosome segregation ATPase